jgi:hypothetical protein
VAIAFGASAITHPVVWFVIPRAWEALYLALVGWSAVFQVRSPMMRYASMVVMAESFAVIVEGIYLRRFHVKRAFAWSLLANGASVTLGFISRWLIDWP